MTRRRTHTSLAVVLLALSSAACSERTPITLSIPDGPILGYEEDDVATFLGLPYALPPVGPLRFAAPEPVAPWTDEHDATRRRASCVRLIPNSNLLDEESSEDCLYVNVWAPVGARDRPVMVWIPGGRPFFGAGSDSDYDGARLARERDVVVVTVSYRQAAFGYLGHPALRATSGRSAGDYALLDQRAALAWVQRNIAAFGGDPGNVTAFGQSAGATSLCMHLVSPGSAGSFHRAILQSGACTLFPMPTRAESEAQGIRLAERLGCEGTDDEVVDCLRSADAYDVLLALPPQIHFLFGDGVSWFPPVDGVTVPEQPLDALRAGASAHVPLVIGTTADEGTEFFRTLDFVYAREDLYSALYGIFSQGRLTDAIIAEYDDVPTSDLVPRLASDAVFCDARRVARLHTESGGVAYRYEFTREIYDVTYGRGAFHSADIPFVFGNGLAGLDLPPTAQRLVLWMQSYWTRFAKTGDPNGEGIRWDPYDVDDDGLLRLDLALSRTNHRRADVCAWWDALLEGTGP